MKQSIRHSATEDSSAYNLEARMVVLEIISMTGLAMALDTSEDGNAEQARGIMELILETVRQRCGEIGMSQQTAAQADRYAAQLLSTALQSLYPNAD